MEESNDCTEAVGKALAKFHKIGKDAGYWSALGGSIDDARQEASIRVLEAKDKYNESVPMGAWLFRNAEFGLLDYERELRADQAKRSPARVIKAGLDDEEVEWRVGEEPIENGQEPVSEEVPGADLERVDQRASLQALLDTVLVGVLRGPERQAIRLRYGLGEESEYTPIQIAEVMDISERTVYRLLQNAMKKLKAEFRAEEIMNL